MTKLEVSLTQFQNLFSTEEACMDHLFERRWPNGFVCPRCGHHRYSFHSARRLHQCCACKYQVSVTAGTVFHKTRTPLRKWFWMIFLMARQKSGVSMMSLQRMLDIRCYKTVWMMGHKIRKAMADRDSQFTIAAIVDGRNAEMDEAKSAQTAGGSKDTSRLRVMAGTDELYTDSRASGNVVQWEGEGGAVIESEDSQTKVWRSYRVKSKDGSERARLMIRSAKDALKELRWAQVLLSNIKGNIRGVHHGVSVKHLGRYLSEFIYRFNRRGREGELFNLALGDCASTRTVTYEELSI